MAPQLFCVACTIWITNQVVLESIDTTRPFSAVSWLTTSKIAIELILIRFVAWSASAINRDFIWESRHLDKLFVDIKGTRIDLRSDFDRV